MEFAGGEDAAVCSARTCGAISGSRRISSTLRSRLVGTASNEGEVDDLERVAGERSWGRGRDPVPDDRWWRRDGELFRPASMAVAA